ncbi:MAG: Hsp20/alpha crystallin family protein [Candidatus Diapherotrites archaeon]|nr:Hsp20/alpha crystallin family protein [Candidatus Diapherotrites archaeon]
MDDDKRRFWRRRNPFFDLFSEFDKIDEMMDEMMKKAFDDFEKIGASGKPLTYGFSIKIGPDGKPQIREFGNIKPTEEKIEVKDAREPLVDVMNRDDGITVLAEMPGVEKKDIDISATEKTLTIKAPDFYKEVELPEEILTDSVKASYKNGVLTVEMKKKVAKPKGKKVRVE